MEIRKYSPYICVMKKKNTKSSGSVKVNPEILQKAKKICKEKGILVSYFVSEALLEKVKKEESN